MSTFDGIVDEFPNIRIDYFRHHIGRTPPAACFLSHVHSDHLQGLETLKMPFVYCSVATKRILLRMEKYPHRINFAKGILEARKQTYKSLRFVLRALPLETPVEIELGPKSKIRVTLFDANHCPGAVMFLIEGSDRTILYTGDVRAEPWWVNSISRNPILLSYCCGARQLDCIYLDTTFASRDDIYEYFPTKADGLKELLTKVSKCPKSSIFYFRSWTLGYEDVWIALSNYLRSPIHVDAYQHRIFKSLSDESHNVDRGPALAGFHFGNQQQLGCLTDDTAVSLHSCEPGTDCHHRLKSKKNVIWITPIISRLKNGVEIAEIGAGGGGGDLYQAPELEVIDEVAFEALQKLCVSDTKRRSGLAKLGEALATARAKGDTNVSLEGLGLDQDEEISLKQFVHLISSKEETNHKSAEATQQRTIHFPYSRHSSYSELRHLVSSFHPRDICPCTVDIDAWTEDVSIQALFGDLCSGSEFKHDQDIRSQAEKRQAGQGRKRKRGTAGDDSQEIESETSTHTEDAYRSAQTSLKRQDEDEAQEQANQKPYLVEEGPPHIPTPVRLLQKALSETYGRANRVRPVEAKVDTYEQAAISGTAEQDGSSPSDQPSSGAEEPPTSEAVASDTDIDSEYDSDTSLPTSTFESQDLDPQPSKRSKDPIRNFKRGTTTQLNQGHKNSPSTTKSTRVLRSGLHKSNQSHTKIRVASRKTAYHAARSILLRDDYEEWSDLRLRSLGWKGHTEEEVEL